MKDTVVFADKLMAARLPVRDRAPASRSASTTWSSPSRRRSWSSDAEKRGQARSSSSTPTGLITNGERYNKVVDIWSHANDQVAKAMMEQLGTEDGQRPGQEARQKSFNSIFMMADSGARGSRGADPPAGRYARPDGQARRLDHRDADHRRTSVKA
jgi:DNA-directed RNA polymerase subunit beta'